MVLHKLVFNTPVKIVFINRFFSPDHSATSQLLTDLTFHLASCGHDIVVITSRQRYDEPTAELPAMEIVQDVRVERIWTTRFGRGSLFGRAFDYITFYISTGWRLLTSLKPGDIVVAKTDPPLLSVLVSSIVYLRRAKQINWIQDLFPEVALALKVRGINRWTFGLLRRLRNVSLKTAKMNIVLSSGMANCLHEEKIHQDRIRIVHNWADGETLSLDGENGGDFRKAWDLDEKFVVGYSGNFGRVHEFTTILEAAKLLINQERVVFLFIGGGAQWEWVKSEKEIHKLNNVLLKPYQPRNLLGKSLSAADVHMVSLQPEVEGYVVPSKFYGVAAVGRPVIYIGNANGEIGQILTEARCGIVVVPGEGKTLADTIMELANDGDKRKTMGKNAQMIFKKRYEKNLALSAWNNILDGAIS